MPLIFEDRKPFKFSAFEYPDCEKRTIPLWSITTRVGKEVTFRLEDAPPV